MTTFALAWQSRPGASLQPDSQCPQHPEQAGVQLPRADRGVDSVDEPALSEVRALTFDIFGTVVDWRSGVVAEGRRIGAEHGVEADWEQVADEWRALYVPYMQRVRSGEQPWTNFDGLHRHSLDQVIADLNIEGFDPGMRDEFTHAWERLPP